jgi:small subunit ribosomal protein S17
MAEEKNEPEAPASRPSRRAAAAAEGRQAAEEPRAEGPHAGSPDEAEAEPEPAPEPEASPEPDAPAPPAGPATPRKTRAERKASAERRAAAKARARAAKPGERKPIVRQPKPEHERGKQKERRGVVVSSAMDKTIVVRVDTIRPHPAYKKVVRRSKKFHAHDEQNAANVGDLVRIVETRPVSKTKSWRLAEILEAAR